MMIEWKKVNNSVGDDSVYADYIEHCARYKEMSVRGDKPTSAHECTHGINSEIRNHFNSENAFYIGNDMGVYFSSEPKAKKSNAVSYVPKELRKSRFSTYITGMKEWEDTPLYLFDEWCAYLAGGETITDMVLRAEPLNRELWKDNSKNPGEKPQQTDLMFAVVEFTVYATAITQFIHENDLQFFQADAFYDFFSFNIRRAIKVFGNGFDVMPWSESKDYYQQLLDSKLNTFLTSINCPLPKSPKVYYNPSR